MIDANAPTPLDLKSIGVDSLEVEVLDGFDIAR